MTQEEIDQFDARMDVARKEVDGQIEAAIDAAIKAGSVVKAEWIAKGIFDSWASPGDGWCGLEIARQGLLTHVHQVLQRRGLEPISQDDLIEKLDALNRQGLSTWEIADIIQAAHPEVTIERMAAGFREAGERNQAEADFLTRFMHEKWGRGPGGLKAVKPSDGGDAS